MDPAEYLKDPELVHTQTHLFHLGHLVQIRFPNSKKENNPTIQKVIVSS